MREGFFPPRMRSLPVRNKNPGLSAGVFAFWGRYGGLLTRAHWFRAPVTMRVFSGILIAKTRLVALARHVKKSFSLLTNCGPLQCV